MTPVLRHALLALACCLGLSGCLLAAAGAGAGAGYVAADQKNEHPANHAPVEQPATPAE